MECGLNAEVILQELSTRGAEVVLGVQKRISLKFCNVSRLIETTVSQCVGREKLFLVKLLSSVGQLSSFGF